MLGIHVLVDQTSFIHDHLSNKKGIYDHIYGHNSLTKTINELLILSPSTGDSHGLRSSLHSVITYNPGSRRHARAAGGSTWSACG